MASAVAAAVLIVGVGPAAAVWRPGPPGNTRAGVPSEVLLSGTGPGHAVSGFIQAGVPSNPSVVYPPDTTGFTPLNEGFAGIIHSQPPGGPPPTLSMYCINILTPTQVGVGYNLGTWSEANVTNVGFVARLLNSYYPNNAAAPPIGVNGVASTADQAAAVQAAIWYFADHFVLAPSDPLLARSPTSSTPCGCKRRCQRRYRRR